MFDVTIMFLSILGGVHSFLNGVREKRYEASCRVTGSFKPSGLFPPALQK